MRRIKGLPVRLAAVLAVVVTVLLASAGPASAGTWNTMHRTFTSYADGNCLTEETSNPSVVYAAVNTECDPGAYYTWKGNNDYTIRNTATGLCLTSSATVDAVVTAALCNGSVYQEWSWVDASRGTQRFYLHNLGNNWYLTHYADGNTKVISHPGNGEDNEVWFQCITQCDPLPQ